MEFILKIELFEKSKKAFKTLDDGQRIPMLYTSALNLFRQNINNGILFHSMQPYGFGHREVIEIQSNTNKIIKYCAENF